MRLKGWPGKQDIRRKHDNATLEKEGSENNSLYTDKVSKTPKHETMNKTSVASRTQLSTPNRTMQDCNLVRKSKHRNNLNITQNSVQTDKRGKTKPVQENKFQPPRQQKVLNKTAMKLGQKNPKNFLTNTSLNE